MHCCAPCAMLRGTASEMVHKSRRAVGGAFRDSPSMRSDSGAQSRIPDFLECGVGDSAQEVFSWGSFACVPCTLVVRCSAGWQWAGLSAAGGLRSRSVNRRMINRCHRGTFVASGCLRLLPAATVLRPIPTRHQTGRAGGARYAATSTRQS